MSDDHPAANLTHEDVRALHEVATLLPLLQEARCGTKRFWRTPTISEAGIIIGLFVAAIAWWTTEKEWKITRLNWESNQGARMARVESALESITGTLNNINEQGTTMYRREISQNQIAIVELKQRMQLAEAATVAIMTRMVAIESDVRWIRGTIERRTVTATPDPP